MCRVWGLYKGVTALLRIRIGKVLLSKENNHYDTPEIPPEKLEVPIMSEALQAYRHVAASDEFKEKERMWAKARHDEAQALYNARQQEREKWQGVAEENERLRKRLAELEAK